MLHKKVLTERKWPAAVLCFVFGILFFYAAFETNVKTFRNLFEQFSYLTVNVMLFCSIYLFALSVCYAGFWQNKLKKFLFDPLVKGGLMLLVLFVVLSYHIGIVPLTLALGEKSLFTFGSVLAHNICPILFILVFCYTPITRKVDTNYFFAMLIYLFVYLTYAVIMALAFKHFSYVFLNFSKSPWWLFPVIVIGCTILFLLLARFMQTFCNAVYQKQTESKSKLQQPLHKKH